MLYGMNEDTIECYEKHINIKKVIIVIAIIIGILLLTFGIVCFLLNKSNSENEVKSETNSLLENEVIETQNEISSQENIVEEIKIEIASHDFVKLRNSFLPKPNENASQEIKNIYFSEEKQVYLTFDDGPSKDITPQILDILRENNVKATFFVLGSSIERYPETLKREFEEGHYIANHGYSHVYSKIYKSKDTVFEEFAKTEDAIKLALGNPDYNSYLFRFPGGSSGGKYSGVKAEARELLNSYGVAFTNWNALTGDAEGKVTKEDCIAEMINTIGKQKSVILLMHDANDKTQTVEALPSIIEYFKNEGYEFKTFYDIFKEK